MLSFEEQFFECFGQCWWLIDGSEWGSLLKKFPCLSWRYLSLRIAFMIKVIVLNPFSGGSLNGIRVIGSYHGILLAFRLFLVLHLTGLTELRALCGMDVLGMYKFLRHFLRLRIDRTGRFDCPIRFVTFHRGSSRQLLWLLTDSVDNLVCPDL